MNYIAINKDDKLLIVSKLIASIISRQRLVACVTLGQVRRVIGLESKLFK